MADTLKSNRPRTGNTIRGKRAVTEIGKASVSHQNAIQRVTPSTFQASGEKPSGTGDMIMPTPKMVPARTEMGLNSFLWGSVG